MKKLLFLGIFAASQLFAATETITTYLDANFTIPANEFEDESIVYVTAVGTCTGSFINGTTAASYGLIKIRFVDLDNDGTYTALFRVSKTALNEDYATLRLLEDEIGTISVDLDSDENIGSATIKSIGRETIRTTNFLEELTTDFLDKETVYITAKVGFTRGGVILGTATSPTGYINLFFVDDNNDGTYTVNFKIDKDGTNTNLSIPPTIKLLLGERATITVDLNQDGRIGTSLVRLVDYDAPLVNLQVSDARFSPYTSPGIKDTTTITLTSLEEGSYTILVDNTTLQSGTITSGQTITLVWDGGGFAEGSHILKAKAWDILGNGTETSTPIFIDSTGPSLSIFALPSIFSPGVSIGSIDFSTITFTSSEPGNYEIKIDGNVPTGVSSGTIISNGTYVWDGSYTTGSASEAVHCVTLTVTDEVGNSSSLTTSVIIDRTSLSISIGNNTGGDIFYRDEIIQFTLKTKDTMERGGMIGLVQGTITKNVSVFYVREGTPEEGDIYQGYYTVAQADVESFTVYGFFTDTAGNPPSVSTFGTITLDGSKIRPTTKARITRIGFIPEKENRPSLQGYTITGSTTDTLTIKWENEDLAGGQKIKVVDTERRHIWVGICNNERTITLNNGLLYYGTPVSDYTKVNPGTSYALRNTLKAGDDIVFSLEAVKIDKELILGTTEKYQGSITIFASNINVGNYILISDNIHTWIATATDNGSFTILNQNLYSGEIISDYRTISPLVGARVSPACGGDSKIDIGSVVRSIPLSDDAIDGIGILSGDISIGDGIYSGVYTIKEGNDTNDAQIIGNFIFNRKSAENSPYQDERQKITIDATAPVISNNSVSPIPFNPYLTNLSIKYNLSEKAYVKIKIYSPNNDLIRTLEFPKAQFGENVTLNWDGKNSGGIVVSDAHYTYYIEAEDEAGNKAITKEGEIVLTSIEIAIENLNVTPNPFWPVDDVKNESKDAHVNCRIVLKNSTGGKVTDEQLRNLNFDFNFENGWGEKAPYFNFLNAPYVLLNIQVLDKENMPVKPSTYLIIQWTMPIYEDGSHIFPNSLGDPLKSDEITISDNLFPFHKNANGNYYYDFSYSWMDWEFPQGEYKVQVDGELVSVRWKCFEVSGNEEKWNENPDFYGKIGGSFKS
ncbi:MAG: FlgD immunoglobulin-like domain containing protein, partial [bacterium]